MVSHCSYSENVEIRSSWHCQSIKCLVSLAGRNEVLKDHPWITVECQKVPTIYQLTVKAWSREYTRHRPQFDWQLKTGINLPGLTNP